MDYELYGQMDTDATHGKGDGAKTTKKLTTQ